MQPTLLDVSHNGMATVLETVYQMASESAVRSVSYIKSLASGARPGPELLYGEGTTAIRQYTVRKSIQAKRSDDADVVKDLSALVHAKVKGKGGVQQHGRAKCTVARETVVW